MNLSTYCINCLVKRQMENISECDNEELKSNYMKEVLSIIAISKEGETAPVIIAKINQLHQKYFGSSYSFESLKYKYNILMLQKEADIWNKILAAEDSLLAALKYARIGNYIDFGAMGSIDDDKLNDLLDTVKDELIESTQYQSFMKDLQNASELVYLTDNCGEIVLDKLFIKTIKNRYPRINITVIVRGKAILNDATVDDAKMVGLTEVTEVIGNGTEIAGTSLEHIDIEAKERILAADMIISKGQGNFETLNGCGLNIYYLFLCKCEWFVKRFGLEQFKGVFVNERNYSNSL